MQKEVKEGAGGAAAEWKAIKFTCRVNEMLSSVVF